MTRYDAYRALMRMDKTNWHVVIAVANVLGIISSRLRRPFRASCRRICGWGFSYAFSGLCDQRLRRSQARRAC